MTWFWWLLAGLVVGGTIGAAFIAILVYNRWSSREEDYLSIWSAAERMRPVKCYRCARGVMAAETDGHAITYRCGHCGLVAAPGDTIAAPVA